MAVSICILNTENLDNPPKTVPTGQIVLHQVLPNLNDINPMIPNVSTATVNDVTDLMVSSTKKNV